MRWQDVSGGVEVRGVGRGEEMGAKRGWDSSGGVGTEEERQRISFPINPMNYTVKIDTRAGIVLVIRVEKQ